MGRDPGPSARREVGAPWRWRRTARCSGKRRFRLCRLRDGVLVLPAHALSTKRVSCRWCLFRLRPVGSLSILKVSSATTTITCPKAVVASPLGMISCQTKTSSSAPPPCWVTLSSVWTSWWKGRREPLAVRLRWTTSPARARRPPHLDCGF